MSTPDAELKTGRDLKSFPNAGTPEFVSAACSQLRSPLVRITEHMTAVSVNDRNMEALLRGADDKRISPKVRSQILKFLESQRAIMKTMQACVEHQGMIINDMMDCSKLEAGQLKLNVAVLDPRQILSQALCLLKAQIKDKNLAVIVNGRSLDEWLDSEDAFLEKQLIGDKVRLLQVILNLLNNAIKFTPKQGEIKIACQIAHGENAMASLHFSIEDNGIGMTKEQMKGLFQPYKQAHSKISAQYGGTGLGLWISKKLIELMGGTIKVESAKEAGGIGSKFIFTVKLSKDLNLDKPASPVMIFSNPKLSPLTFARAGQSQVQQQAEAPASRIAQAPALMLSSAQSLAQAPGIAPAQTPAQVLAQVLTPAQLLAQAQAQPPVQEQAQGQPQLDKFQPHLRPVKVGCIAVFG